MAAGALRLCLFNPIDRVRPVAERELALRLAIAMDRLGWTSSIAHHAAGIEGGVLDGVLNLFPAAAGKMTDHCWLGCAWGPVGLLDGMEPAARRRAEANELSHDAYLVSGPGPRAHLERLLNAASREVPLLLPFHVSSPQSHLPPQLGPGSRLFYVGANWDGQRFPLLLKRLADAGVLALHGTAERWSPLADAWQGPLPFDGTSVIRAAHHWGMGLCLHLPQHRAEGVPNMRVFELAAAGAVIIADRHPFIEEWFGDRVLYVETNEGEEEAAASILEQVAWVRAHPGAARAMAAEAQAIFNRHLCLEALLSPLPGRLADMAARRAAPTGRRVGVLLPGGDPGHRLTVLAGQQDGDLAVTALVTGASNAGGPGTAPPGLALRWLDGPPGLAALRAGLDGLDALAILPKGVAWPAGHLARLTGDVQAGRGAVLTAGIWPLPAGGTGFPLDPLEDRALCPRPGTPVPSGQEGALAVLRTGGFCVGVERLAGLEMPCGDWLSLALNLPPLLAGEGVGLDWQPVPGPRLAEPAEDGISTGDLRPWPDMPAPPDTAGAERQPRRLTALNDLAPALAASLPFMRDRRDFAHLPGAGPLWLYGTGRGGELVLEALGPSARQRLAGFLDSSREGMAHGLPLRRPCNVDPAAMSSATIIIAAQYVSDMLRTLRALPVAPAHILNAYPFIADRIEASS